MINSTNFPLSLDIWPDYLDENILIFTDLRKVPEYRDSVRLDFFALLLCIRGEISLDILGFRRRIVAGECVIGRPGETFAECRQSPDFIGRFFMISPDVIEECISGNERWTRIFLLNSAPTVRIPPAKLPIYELYIETIRRKTELAGTCDPYARRSLISLVRAALYDLIADLGDADAASSREMRQPELLFKRFIALLESKEVKPRTVGWYADNLCVTPKYLSAVCKETSGLTAYDWIRRAILDDIRHQLKYTTHSIKEVAVGLGFSNVSFFGKFVRGATGLSPRRLRSSLRTPSVKSSDQTNNHPKQTQS